MTREFNVIGPPGSGKTTHLSHQASRAADKHGAAGVVICSLTRTAATEIASRTTLPDRNVGTLHALCYQALDAPDMAEDPDVLKAWNEEQPGWRRTIKKTSSNDPSRGTTRGDQHHQDAQVLRASMIALDRWPSVVAAYQEQWTAFKQHHGVRDFTDLIAECARTGIRRAPSAFLVDEAQDMSRLEMQAIRATAARADTTVLAGDPAQALFLWRGADPHAMDGGDETRILATSWRCGQTIIDRARTLLRRYQPKLDVDYHAQKGRAGQVLSSRARWQDPAAILQEIQTNPDGTFMVVGTCAHLLGPTARLLKDRAIPFHNPHRPDNTAWNPMRQATALKALLAFDPQTAGAGAHWWTWADVKQWSTPLIRSTMVRGGWDLINHKNTRDQFGQTSAHEDVDPDTLADILGSLDHPLLTSGIPGQVQWWSDHLARPKTMRMVLAVWRRNPTQLATTPRVILGTAHSVKGAAADTVLVLPDTSGSAWWGGDRGAVARTMYVAMTRARHTLILARPEGPESMAL